MSITVVDVTDPTGQVVQPALLRQAERVHRELRPQLPEDYVAKMGRVFAGGGRMTVALVGEAVVGDSVGEAVGASVGAAVGDSCSVVCVCECACV